MIQVFRPLVDTEKILNELRPVLESGWIGLGPKQKNSKVSYLIISVQNILWHLIVQLPDYT